MAKKKFSNDYIKYGFTSILDNGEEKGQGVLCYKILGNHSLRPSKLMLHFEKVRPEQKHKNAEFFKRKKVCVKRQRLDASGAFR